MPYKTNSDLPKKMKDNLPKGAETIFRKAYNSAADEYKDSSKRRGGASLEETANKVAWSAVKKEYEKVGDEWKKK